MKSWLFWCVLLLSPGLLPVQAQTTQPQSQPTSRAATQPATKLMPPATRP